MLLLDLVRKPLLMIYSILHHVCDNLIIVFSHPHFISSVGSFSIRIDNSGDSLDRYQLNLLDPATPIAFGIHSLHNHIMFFLCVILSTVLFLLCSILYHFSFYQDKYYTPMLVLYKLANKVRGALVKIVLSIARCTRSVLFLPIFHVKETKVVAIPKSRWCSAGRTTFYLVGAAIRSLLRFLEHRLRERTPANRRVLKRYFYVPSKFRGYGIWFLWIGQFRKLTIFHSDRLFILKCIRYLPTGLLDYFVSHYAYLSLPLNQRFLNYTIIPNGVFSTVSNVLQEFGYVNESVLPPRMKPRWLRYLVAHRQYRVTHNLDLEVIWTIIPTLILVIIAIPSFALLYSMDELLDPTVTVKVIGHQWYWSYEYSDLRPLLGTDVAFDSYMVPDADLVQGDLRLLKTDCPLILPKETNIRFLITSTDVLHSWAVPSFGIKMDAVPGRLNQTSTYIMECGRYYGQCSELCGVNHGFMPIEVCVVEPVDYYNWLFLKSK